MSKTQAGQEAWAFICMVVAPALPPVTTKTKIKEAAYAAFNVGDKFPQSRIDEAAQERCGWATKAAIEARARELRLRLPEGSTGYRNITRPCENDGEYITRLQATANRLRHSGTEFGRIEAENIERAIAQIEGRLVAGPPLRD